MYQGLSASWGEETLVFKNFFLPEHWADILFNENTVVKETFRLGENQP